MNSAFFGKTNGVIAYTDATLDLSAKTGLLMVAGGNGLIVNTSATVQAPFICLSGQVAGRPNSIGVLGDIPPVRMVAAGAISQYAIVSQDAGGGIKASLGVGNARVDIGIALEAATAAGQYILVASWNPDIGS